MVATVGVLVYLISYWFFDGYLTRYGYSMRAIPHDYAAIMMESFLLVFHGLLVALSSPSWVYVLLALIGGMLIYLWLVLGVGVVIGAAVKSWQVRRRLRLKNGGQWWVQVRPPTWLAAHLDPIKRMAAKSLVGALLPLLLTAFLLCAGLVLVISVLGAYRFGIWVASEEIKSFVSCDKRDVARCATYKTKANATITGEVIAGTATTLLVFDGTNAYLLQRSDALSAESRAK